MSTTFLSEDMTRYYEDMWIAHQLEALSNGKYRFLNNLEFGNYKNEFWSIISADEWSNISFHFELNWKRGLPITNVSKINIPIHLETKKGHEELYRKARECFEAQGYSFIGEKEGAILASDNSKFHESITPDFSSEEAAKATIREIIKILDSESYQKCAHIINEFIREQQNKN
ncbi:hypothetical protein [Ruminococcus flavefaciens]|uniref:Uncharacterized protein n=1 Tax=Ruminococcus flavefaciens TaxID=1265 RepID=A0A1M7IGW2_RUMFL|nr:hypothetical protein [Ruminococcus flavefaciens]SEH48763.1 hypothetical protein SAMN02910265_01013 [Ruminococcus flavefaciens]SHM39981.1 hypothetical protein SAMN04487860_104111 [Ruminococcus flavefaciens]